MARRKTLIPTIFLAVLAWAGAGYLIYKTSPNAPLPISSPFPIPSVSVFFLLLFLACFLSFALVFNNTRRGFLVSVGLTALATLRLFHLFHPLYIILIIALLITTEIYFLKR